MRDVIRVLYFYPYLNFDTGSPKALAQCIDALDRTLFKPLFYAVGDGPLVRELVSRGVEIVAGDSQSITWRRPLAGLSAVRRRMAELRTAGVDVLHVNGFFWNIDLVVAAWLLNLPVVLHVHVAAGAGFQNLHRFAARKVLFCSQFLLDNFGHPERIEGKAEVLHNAIDVGRFGSGTSIREALGLQAGDIAIGTVAVVAEHKGIDIAIEAARMLAAERSDLVFLIAGRVPPGSEAFARRMAAAVADPGFGGRVRFLGSRSDVPDFLASLDVFLLPSRVEAFGIAVLEAMAAGLPLIASTTGGIPEIVSSPDLGVLVDSLDASAFAAAIRGVLSRPDRGRSMGANARASVIMRFDQAGLTGRLRDIYLDLIPGASAR